MEDEDVEFCPKCGGTDFVLCKNTNFLWLCKCGAKFEVSFYSEEYPCR